MNQRMALLPLCTLVLGSGVAFATRLGPGRHLLQTSFTSSLLAQTNVDRAQHGTSALSFNSGAQSFAQSWVDKCQYAHSGNSQYGENIYVTTAPESQYTAQVAENAWYNKEQPLYSYNNPGFSEATGHFTQVVWGKTQSIGCASKTCDNVAGFPYGKATLVSCNYYPPGNVAGQYSSNVPQLISTTPAGGSNVAGTQTTPTPVPTVVTPAPTTAAPTPPPPTLQAGPTMATPTPIQNPAVTGLTSTTGAGVGGGALSQIPGSGGGGVGSLGSTSFNTLPQSAGNTPSLIGASSFAGNLRATLGTPAPTAPGLTSGQTSTSTSSSAGNGGLVSTSTSSQSETTGANSRCSCQPGNGKIIPGVTNSLVMGFSGLGGFFGGSSGAGSCPPCPQGGASGGGSMSVSGSSQSSASSYQGGGSAETMGGGGSLGRGKL